ncbi:dicarboxylate/amino acid:cation symporter, partial [Acinetobacter baumannii]|nr:dicarboxylate/amino acid:cation symporter [Acinetobacter baumannii]
MPTEKNNVDMNLNTQILIAAILGLAFGFLLTMYPDTAFVKHSLY